MRATFQALITHSWPVTWPIRIRSRGIIAAWSKPLAAGLTPRFHFYLKNSKKKVSSHYSVSDLILAGMNNIILFHIMKLHIFGQLHSPSSRINKYVHVRYICMSFVNTRQNCQANQELILASRPEPGWHAVSTKLHTDSGYIFMKMTAWGERMTQTMVL